MVTLVGIWKVCISRLFPYPLSSRVIIAWRRVQLHRHCDGWVSFRSHFLLLYLYSVHLLFALLCVALLCLLCAAMLWLIP